MNQVKSNILAIALLFIPLLAWADNAHTEEGEGGINTKEIIFGHIGDSYDWHLFSINGHHVSIPLPVIVKSAERGWFVFSSSRLAHGETYNGFFISEEDQYHDKVVEKNASGEMIRPLDLSFTRNACSIVLTCLLLAAIFLTIARSYRKDPLRSRKGFAGAMEMLFLFIYEDMIKPSVGKEYRKYAPYILTAFFFVLFSNLLGLVPIFPGGANVTGNIAVTMVLALITFLITNFSGTKEYWKEIFWPDVPVWLKFPVPLMPIIEIIGILTKPFSLMVRLFANMLAGHMIVLVLISLIFVFTALMGVVAGGAVTIVSILFSVFMILIDILVSFIQAYVFAMLSAIFIGMAIVEPHHKKEEALAAGAVEK